MKLLKQSPYYVLSWCLVEFSGFLKIQLFINTGHKGFCIL